MIPEYLEATHHMVGAFFFLAPAVIAAVGLAVAAVGTGVSVYGQMQAKEAADEAEKLRKKQMDLEAARRRREIAREMQRKRAEALATSVSQGAEAGSGLPGGYAQIGGRAALSDVAISQGQTIGAGIFNANRELATGQTWNAFGESATNFGMKIAGNSEDISNTAKSYGLWGDNGEA